VPLNLDAVGTETEAQTRTWTSTDALLYAVAVGAGSPDPTGDLTLTTENSSGVTQQVLPTFCTLLGSTGALRGLGTFDPAMLVHAEQRIELHAPLPASGSARVVGRLVEILDKRSGALVVSATEAHDAATGAPLFTARSGAFIRGEGGFAAGAAPTTPPGPPDRPPDRTARRTARSRSRRCRTRPCSTGSAGTATHCTRTPPSRHAPASTAPSCTACAPTASPAARSHARSATTTRRACARWLAGSRAPSGPASR
jgi:hypothetical protein